MAVVIGRPSTLHVVNRLEHVGAAVAADGRVAAREVGQDGNGNRVAARGLSEYNAVVEAHQKATHRIDPQQRSSRMFGSGHRIVLARTC